MIHSQENSTSMTVPVVAILLAMFAMIAGLLIIGGDHHRQIGRIWVPEQQISGGPR